MFQAQSHTNLSLQGREEEYYDPVSDLEINFLYCNSDQIGEIDTLFQTILGATFKKGSFVVQIFSTNKYDNVVFLFPTYLTKCML